MFAVHLCFQRQASSTLETNRIIRLRSKMVHARRDLDARIVRSSNKEPCDSAEGLPVLKERSDSTTKEAHAALLEYSQKILGLVPGLVMTKLPRKLRDVVLSHVAPPQTVEVVNFNSIGVRLLIDGKMLRLPTYMGELATSIAPTSSHSAAT